MSDQTINSIKPQARILQQQMIGDLMNNSSPHQRALVRFLGICDRHDLPTSEVVRCFSDEQSAKYYQKLTEGLADHLDEQGDLMEGLAVTPELVSSECLLALRLADSDQSRTELYDDFLAHVDEEPVYKSSDRNFAFKYLKIWLKFFVIASILTYMFIRVIPEFKDMMLEFGCEAPAVFDLFVYIGNLLLIWVAPVLFLSLIFFVLPLNFGPFRRSLQRWSPDSWQQSFVPVSVSRRRCVALILQSGRTIEEGLGLIASDRRLNKVFKKLNDVSQIEKRFNPWKSLATNGIITSREFKALGSTDRLETQAWLLQQRSEETDEALTKRAGYISQFVVGVVNTIIAILVLLAALSVFTVSISLMEISR